jgi:hypothetical protein
MRKLSITMDRKTGELRVPAFARPPVDTSKSEIVGDFAR